MKRYFFIVGFALISTFVFAQRRPISFNGIAMGQPFWDFVNQIEAMDYSLDKYEENKSALLTGHFKGFLSAVIVGTDNEGKVNDVTWIVSPPEDWDEMYRAYSSVESVIMNIFGTPDMRVVNHDKYKLKSAKISALKRDEIELRINYLYPHGAINMWLGYLNSPVVMTFYRLSD